MNSTSTSLNYQNYYDTFINESIFPSGIKKGQSFQLLNRTYDGDIADHMLNNYQIMSFNYYIGTKNETSESFFPDVGEIIGILSESYPAAYYFILKAGDFLKYEYLFKSIFLLIFV